MAIWVEKIFFVAFGLSLISVSVAVLIDFRGLGTWWDRTADQHREYLGRGIRFPWRPQASGPATRQVLSLMGVVVGALIVGLVLLGAVR